MSPRLALWLLWTALSLCLPGATTLELCLCDGPRGLFDGVACGAADAEEQRDACCCAPEPGSEPRLESQGERSCGCVTVDVRGSEPVAHTASVPATVLRAPSAPAAVVATLPALPLRAVRDPRARVRSRAPDGLPLRI